VRERKVKLEVHVGRDDEGRWWVIASVNDEEALQHGPYEDPATAEKEAVKLVAATIFTHTCEERLGTKLRWLMPLATVEEFIRVWQQDELPGSGLP
jgi:hypothetical protein